MSALRIGCIYPPGKIPGTHFCHRLGWSQGHIAARTKAIKNINDPIGDSTRDLSACSEVNSKIKKQGVFGTSGKSDPVRRVSHLKGHEC
jgi:hypothetical protein